MSATTEVRAGQGNGADRRPNGSSQGTGQPPEELLAAAAEGAELRRLRRNEILFEHGAPARELFVVRSGRVGIFNLSADGRESLVALMSQGDILGVPELFDNGPRPTQARALEPSTVLAIGHEPIRRVLEQRPTLLWGLGRLLAGRLRAVGDTLADAVFLDLTARTAKHILELGEGADEFDLPVTQEELAAIVGASRERVNKAIAAFGRLGWLEQRGRHYRIQDRQKLADRARG